MSNHKICIYERLRQDASDPTCCTVKITIDGNALKGRYKIKDPFSHYPHEPRHSRIARYLEDALGDDEFKQSSAAECEAWIREYRHDLFKSLRLGDLTLKESLVEVNIFPYTDLDRNLVASDSSLPILSIYWELLELVPRQNAGSDSTHLDRGNRRQGRIPSSSPAGSEWPQSVSQVCVRRVVPVTRINYKDLHHSVPERASWSVETGLTSSALHACRVLLVIARDLKLGPGEYQISPSYIKKELLQIFEDLNKDLGREFYRLEVVRPGSCQELRRHLEAAKAAQKPFQMVHFDMHGLVKCVKPDCGKPRNEWRVSKQQNSCRIPGDGHRGAAFLTFAARGSEGKLVTENVPASDVARLLQEHNIRCVALNACESARTNDGQDSNLSYTFLLHGVANVVAMSFRASDAMFALYFRNFYTELFQYRRDFSAATSDARYALRKLDKRESARDGRVHMEDWFVPVTYCDEKVIMMPDPSETQSEGKLENVDSEKPHHHDAEGDSRAQDKSEPVSTYRRLFKPKEIMVLAIVSFWLMTLLRGSKELRALVIRLLLLSGATVGSLCLWIVSRSALSLRYERSIRASEITCRILDNNMLNIENELKNHQPVVLHGLRQTSDTLSLLENLIFVWLRTGFVDQVVVIPAAWFYQPLVLQKLRIWCCKSFHHRNCCFGDHTLARQALLPQQRMFVVTDLERLFPQDPVASWNWAQAKLQSDARLRFKNFLCKYFQDAERSKDGAVVVSAGCKTPFLLLSGSPMLQDEDLLKTTLDRMDIVGMRSTPFSEASEDDIRTARIEASNEIDRKRAHQLVSREVSTLSTMVSRP